MKPNDQIVAAFNLAQKNDWVALKCNLKQYAGLDLTDAQMAALKAAVEDAAKTVNDWQEEASRRDREKIFSRRFIGLLEKLDRLVGQNEELFTSAVRAGELSYHLSYAACAAAIGPEAFKTAFPAGSFETGRRASASLGPDNDLINLEGVLPAKGHLDADHAVALAKNMIGVLKRPFAAASKEPNPSGRPRNIPRAALIFHLAISSVQILGKPSDAAENSSFLNLCTQVAAHLGIADTGLLDVVKRLIQSHKIDIDWASLPTLQALAALEVADQDVDPEPDLRLKNPPTA